MSLAQEPVTTSQSKELSKNESNADLLVRSYLLQTLMNETGTTNKPQSLPPDESLVAKPRCGNTGNFPLEESKSI